MTTLSKFLVGSAVVSALLTAWEISETAKDFPTEGIPFTGIAQLFIGLTLIQWTFICLIAGLGWLLDGRK